MAIYGENTLFGHLTG